MTGIASDFIKKRVVIYARVSTEHEAQISALENQVDWYQPILEAKPEWILVGTYIDEGITGTSAEKRPQFMEMIADAKKKKFDMIITREVSRFARNTVDTLQYTRTLKEYGVEVFFINDNIKTLDGDGELRLAIMATLAQDESRKTSIRVKAGQQTSMEKGVIYGNGNILGYKRVETRSPMKKVEFVLDPEQAKTVRMIFDMYLDGMGCNKIQFELEKAGRLTAMGKTRWFCSTVLSVLKNSFYCGIITYHKEYTPDYLKQKKIKNFGEKEFTYTQGTHEAIVTVEEFERVQKMLYSRTQQMDYLKTGRRNQGKHEPKSIWSKLMKCECGASMNMRSWNRYKGKSDIAYICYTVANKGSKQTRINKGLSIEDCCETPIIPRWKLEMIASHIFDNYISSSKSVVKLATKMIEDHINDKEKKISNANIIKEKQDEIIKLNKKLDALIEMRSDQEIPKEVFRVKSTEVSKRIEKLEDEITSLTPTEENISNDTFFDRLDSIKEKLNEYMIFKNQEHIPDELIEAFFQRIIVSKDEFRWYLRGELKNSHDAKRLLNLPEYNQEDLRDCKMIASFTIDIEQAKKYVYGFSTKHRVHRWQDLKVSIWL